MNSRKHTAKHLNHVAGVIAALGLILVSSGNAQAQLAPQVVHVFSASGSFPNGVIQGKDGNFYGTTSTGGAGGGTVFKLTAAGVLTTLHDFDCSSEGCSPFGDLVQAKDGNFYGTTPGGGALGGGTAFRLTPAGVLETLHDFDCSTEGCSPQAALIQASDGNFYGTTPGGGALGGGTVFKLTPAGVLTTLHDFDCSKDCAPVAALIQASNGNFYGTTVVGGAFGSGTVFKLTRAGALTTLHDFDCSTEGCDAFAALIQATDGNFYGTTRSGGALGGGTAFKLTPAGVLETLHDFDCSTEGCVPQAALIQASDGNFYGTATQFGAGALGGGTAFKLTPAGVLTTLHAFDCSTESCDCSTEGCSPTALIQAKDGNFYGTTAFGGAFGVGTVFKLTPAGVLTTLAPFGCGPEDCFPVAALIQASDGNFYGTTLGASAFGVGGFGGGSVFKLTPAGVLTTLHAFDCSTGGCNPFGALIQDSRGNFYGTTSAGGAFGGGTVFKLPPAGALKTLHDFDCSTEGSTEGCLPAAALIQDSDGNFYGTTLGGGKFGGGTVFKLTPEGVLTILHDFDCSNSGAACLPAAALIQDSDGNFYGTTSGGGRGHGVATVFKLTSAGVLTTLATFGCSDGSGGCSRDVALIQASDGNFYGTTRSGDPDSGPLGGGTVFKLTPAGDLETLHEFDCSPTEGCNPFAALIQARDGNFYGTTLKGGAFGRGTVFKLTPAGVFTTLHAFDCVTEGCGAQAALIQASDGRLYGTLPSSGPKNGGVVFRLVPDTLTAFSPALVWIGLKNSDDVGLRFDLRAEVYRNTTLIGSGELASVAGGSSGFNNAKPQSIPLALLGPDPVPFGIADTLSLKVSVRNACTGSGKNSGTARLWFNDTAANSRFDATIAETTRDYFLRTDFALSLGGGATKQSLDVAVGPKCGPFVPFGTWSIVVP